MMKEEHNNKKKEPNQGVLVYYGKGEKVWLLVKTRLLVPSTLVYPRLWLS